eukprot:gene9001-biopygen8885
MARREEVRLLQKVVDCKVLQGAGDIDIRGGERVFPRTAYCNLPHRRRENVTDALSRSFDKRRANDRKAWLQSYDTNDTLDYQASQQMRVCYGDFIDKDLKHFSNYDVLRSVPSVVDGLKGTIIAMAQNFVGAGNNLNLLQPIGQFGSCLGGGSDHASPRYINTCLEPVTRALFPREDDRVLEYLTDDGTSMEPRFYAPIIPLVLANGADGIGTGYSTHIPCFDPRDLVIAIRERICGTERITKLKPWYKGFRGEVGGIRVNGREVITGSVVKETLENFVGDNAKGVKGFSNESTEDNVSFTITFSNSATASSWLQVNTTQDSEAHNDDIGYGDTVNGLTRLEIELKMYVSKPLCMTNMHLFDASGRIRKYSSPEEILDEFLEQRMKVYVQRKAWLERKLAETLCVLEQKVRFVELVVTGELDVFKEVVDDDNDNDDEVEDDDDNDSSGLDSSSMQPGTVSPDAKERKRVHALERHGLKCVKGSFRYLLSMPVSCLTKKRKDALERERDARRTELEAVRVTDEKDMYIRDLERLEKFLIKKRYVKSYNVADNGIYGLENIAYNKVVPNITVKGKISFQTPKNNNTDNYTLRKVVHGVDKSSLRLTINDDSDEVFEIWGDSCANGGCGGEGVVAHKFTADGNAWHKGGMTAGVTNVNRIKLGNKWSLSGVGDKDGNDDWLRLFNKDGTGYYGGLAAGRLWSVGATTLDGPTTLNGPTYTKDITASGNLNVNGGNANVCIDRACITKGDINTFKAAKGSISQLQHDLTATTSIAKTQQKVSAENEITIANLQQELSATNSLAQTQQNLSAMNERPIAQLQQEFVVVSKHDEGPPHHDDENEQDQQNKSAPTVLSLSNRCAAEVVACFFFHILGSLSPTPWCNAATLSIMVLATARISGAHLNPCVTWVFTLMGYTHPHEAVLYAVLQYVGCVLGAMYLSLMIPGVSVGGPGLGCFSPSEGITDRRVLAIEGLGTFVFTLCVFAVVWYTQNKHGYGTIGPIMIGLALLAPALAIGPLTGGAMNPARVLASPTVFNEGAGCKGEFLGVYVGAEMLGATLSAICVLLCFGVAEVPWYPYSVRKVIRRIVEAARHPPFVTYSLVRGD